MNREFVIESSREYLVKIGYNSIEVDIFSDDLVLEKVNMLFFGGIQAFARRLEKERVPSTPSRNMFPI